MAAWYQDAEVLVVAGKGGVGKTTVSAALAATAAADGADVLVVAVDGRPGLGRLLGGPAIRSTPSLLRHRPGEGAIRGRTIPPEKAFADYLALRRVGAVLRRAASAASLDVLAASTPGLQHLLVLGKIKELARERKADVIIVDAPPAGRAGPFLRSASALQKLVPTGPIRDQADEVAAMLTDPARCRVTLVTLAEETPVTETVELAIEVEHQLGIALSPVIVNGCWPDLDGILVPTDDVADRSGARLAQSDLAALRATTDFLAPRLRQQRAQQARLAEALPLTQIALPNVGRPDAGPHEIDALATVLRAAER